MDEALRILVRNVARTQCRKAVSIQIYMIHRTYHIELLNPVSAPTGNPSTRWPVGGTVKQGLTGYNTKKKYTT